MQRSGFLREYCYAYVSVTLSLRKIMKYQQLENLECGWKWAYLVKKHREGEEITRYTEKAGLRKQWRSY